MNVIEVEIEEIRREVERVIELNPFVDYVWVQCPRCGEIFRAFTYDILYKFVENHKCPRA